MVSEISKLVITVYKTATQRVANKYNDFIGVYICVHGYVSMYAVE